MTVGAAPEGVVVSVLAFHSITTIERCVRSVAAQELDRPITLHVREQGHDDDELALIRELAATLGRADRRIVVDRGDNLGYAGGHNLVARSSEAATLLFLNADAWLEPDYLERALIAFDDPEVGAVQGLVWRDDASGGEHLTDSTGIELTRSRRAFGRDQARIGGYPGEGAPFGVDGAVLLLRGVAARDVALPGRRGPELFAESFVAYKEDVDLAYRLRWAGWRTAFVPAARAWHRRSVREDPGARLPALLAQRWDVDPERYALGFANTRLAMLRNERAADLVRDALWIGPREVAAWAVLLARPRVAARAVAHLTAGVPAAGRARRRILARRRVRTLTPLMTGRPGGMPPR